MRFLTNPKLHGCSGRVHVAEPGDQHGVFKSEAADSESIPSNGTMPSNRSVINLQCPAKSEREREREMEASRLWNGFVCFGISIWRTIVSDLSRLLNGWLNSLLSCRRPTRLNDGIQTWNALVALICFDSDALIRMLWFGRFASNDSLWFERFHWNPRN